MTRYTREVRVTINDEPSSDWIFEPEDFKIFGRALELMYLTGANTTAVDLILEAETGKTGLYLKGYVDAARAAFMDESNFVVFSVYPEGEKTERYAT